MSIFHVKKRGRMTGCRSKLYHEYSCCLCGFPLSMKILNYSPMPPLLKFSNDCQSFMCSKSIQQNVFYFYLLLARIIVTSKSSMHMFLFMSLGSEFYNAFYIHGGHLVQKWKYHHCVFC